MKATSIGIALVISPTGVQDARIRDKMCKHRQFTPRTRNRFRERELARAVARSEKRRRRAREDRDPQSGNISVILPWHREC
jgi:hypothetical protein